jgi:hypothetical protein
VGGEEHGVIELYSKNEFENLVHLVGFIIRIRMTPGSLFGPSSFSKNET